MKRSIQEVAGGPQNRDLRPAVAGRRPLGGAPDVASVRAGDAHPASKVATEEADLLADFTDFMNGEEALDLGLLPAPDSTFRERLRRRLWRSYVLSYLRGGSDISH